MIEIGDIFEAIKRNNVNAFDLMCPRDVNKHGKGGITPLMLASQLGNVLIVSRLISHGANVNAVDDAGKTALHYALEEYRD